MGKISDAARKHYFDRIKEYKTAIEEMQRWEKSLLNVIQSDETGAEYKRLILADEVLNRVSYYLLMNSLSVFLLGVKNETYLNDARKDCYKSIIYLEEVGSPYIDVPFSDYEEKLGKISDFSDEKRYALLQKLGFSIQSLIDGFGDNSKWKWSFVEIEGRYATLTKNLLNLKTLIAGMDPRVPGYEARLSHLQIAKKSLQQAADRYRQKYELSTLRLDDFKLAISYLSAFRRLLVLLGETAESEVVKKKIEVWKAKMEDDLQKMEKKT
ncbi:MAG: hypothetical protein AB1798_24410 [Spirochaetota bacterium]